VEFRQDPVNVLLDIVISEEVVLKCLNRLSPNKATGVHGIATRVLTESAQVIVTPLLATFNRFMKDGMVPNEWKNANVCAIYKKGSKNNACNYRPVSLTSHVCKDMETVVKNSILAHLNRHRLIKKTQHGFIKNKCCLTNLLEFLEKVSGYIDNGQPVDIIFLDFQKAFDKVPHRRLILKALITN